VYSGIVHQSILLGALNTSCVLPPAIFCNAYCAIYGFSPTPLGCHSTYDIGMVLAVSCKGRPPSGRPHILALPTMVYGVPACGQPRGLISATRRSSGVAPRACARVYARVLVPGSTRYPIIYLSICIYIYLYLRRHLSIHLYLPLSM